VHRTTATIHDVIRLGLACIFALLAIVGCARGSPTATASSAIFVVDSATASCADGSVGVDLAIEHAVARPGYLDCITVTLRADADGTTWICEPMRSPDEPLCDGPRMELRGANIDRLPATWHPSADIRWSDPIQLLGRVRFL
jgi:hypothetical protein